MTASRKRKWRCRDPDTCAEWLSDPPPTHLHDIGDCHRFLLEMQARWQDERTCAQRHADQMPMQLRDLYAGPELSTCPREQ